MIDDPTGERDKRIFHMKQHMRYSPERYKADWETAVACAHIMGFEPGHEHLRGILEDCMDRVNAWVQVTNQYPWE